MNQRVSNILIGLVVLGLVLLAVLGPQFLPKFSKLHKVFDSPVNMGLVAVLVVLIAIFNIKVGVAFAFLVLMFAVYLMDDKHTQKIEDFFAVVKTLQGKVELGTPRTASVRLVPNTNLETFQNEMGNNANNSNNVNKQNNVTDEKSKNLALNNKVEMNVQPVKDHVDKILKEAVTKVQSCATPEQYDFLTQQAPNDFRINGYDVAGCRYDLASRPQNLTVYGPPLSWCATYDQQQASKCGTLFYPLNG